MLPRRNLRTTSYTALFSSDIGTIPAKTNVRFSRGFW